MQFMSVKSTLKKLVLFVLGIPIASHAQQTCQFQKETGEPAFSKIKIAGKGDQPSREIILSCTSEEDVVKVSLQESKSKHILQSFLIKQNRFYLKALTPDLDQDGFQDFVLPTALGNPDVFFKAWRYDPKKKRLVPLFEEGVGLEFYRSKSDDIVIYRKSGIDRWTKIIYQWKGSSLIEKYEIVIPVNTMNAADCTYYQLSPKLEIPRYSVLPTIKSYCNLNTYDEMKVNFLENLK